MNETPEDAPKTPPSAPQRTRTLPPFTTPPPLPGQHALYASLANDLGPMENGTAIARVAECLLKCPGRITYEITAGRFPAVVLSLMSIASLCLLAFGIIVGLFPGGGQLWLTPVKIWVGTLLSALLCLPSLYVFACLAGGRQSLAATIGLLAQALALMGILLVGFAPIAWLFSQSTNSAAFMGFLFLVFWLTSAAISLELLIAAMRALNQRNTAMLRVWCVVFLAVTLQMSTTLRPLVGKFDGFRLQEKQFFVAHWVDCMDKSDKR